MSVSSRRPVPEASSPFRPPLWPVLCVSIALAACSGDSSAQGSHSQSQTGQSQASQSQTIAPPASIPTVSAAESAVRALPDFSPLVEKYGPAVVNVEVVEKAQPATGGGPQGLSPNDP